MYSPTVLDHFQSPRNVGDLSHADGIGEAGNPISGNTIKLSLKIDNKTIVDAKFRTFGCAASIAASSMLTKMPGPAMAADGVKAAIEDYKKRADDHIP